MPRRIFYLWNIIWITKKLIFFHIKLSKKLNEIKEIIQKEQTIFKTNKTMKSFIFLIKNIPLL